MIDPLINTDGPVFGVRFTAYNVLNIQVQSRGVVLENVRESCPIGEVRVARGIVSKNELLRAATAFYNREELMHETGSDDGSKEEFWEHVVNVSVLDEERISENGESQVVRNPSGTIRVIVFKEEFLDKLGHAFSLAIEALESRH